MDVDKTVTAVLSAAKQENELRKTQQSYNAVIALIAELQKQLHDSERKIIDNLKS